MSWLPKSTPVAGKHVGIMEFPGRDVATISDVRRLQYSAHQLNKVICILDTIMVNA